MTNTPIHQFFQDSPQSKPLFDAIAVALLASFPNTSFKIQKSQIALIDQKPYGALWLPIRPIKERPEVSLILSFGLDHKLVHERIVEVNEPYPNRFMHHILISDVREIDETVIQWLTQAIAFSNRARQGTP